MTGKSIKRDAGQRRADVCILVERGNPKSPIKSCKIFVKRSVRGEEGGIGRRGRLLKMSALEKRGGTWTGISFCDRDPWRKKREG